MSFAHTWEGERPKRRRCFQFDLYLSICRCSTSLRFTSVFLPPEKKHICAIISHSKSFVIYPILRALNWVQQEQSCKLEREWKVIKSKYKAGGGDKGDVALPFPIDESMVDPRDREDAAKRKQEAEEVRKKMKDAMAGVQNDQISPADLLKDLKCQREKAGEVGDTTSNLSDVLNLGGGAGGERERERNKPLIEEINPAEEGGAESDKKKKTKKAKPLGKQMKGFLNTEAAKKGIYDEKGSSGDGIGGQGGSYSKFMSRCKVVDTSSMSQEEQERMMKQHAAGSGGPPSKEEPASSQSRQPPPPAPPPPAKAATTTDSIKKNKGFLEGTNRLYGGKGSNEGTGDDGSFDAEFHKLMEMADPSFAANFEDPRAKKSLGGDHEDTLTEALHSLAKVDFNVGPNDGLDMER